MADGFGAGLAFRNFLAQAAPAAAAIANPFSVPARAAAAAVPTIGDFLSGLTGVGHNTATVVLPDPKPVAAVAAPVAPAGPVIMGPASAAAAAQAYARGAAKAPAGAAPAAADPLGGLGKLSFRQLLSLSQADENMQPKGTTRTPSTADAAGAALASIYQQQFKTSLDAAGKDPAKQQAAVDAFEKKMLPIALKGSGADALGYGYGQSGGQ